MTRKVNSILFASFSVRKVGERTATNGMIEPLSLFFTQRSKTFTLIEQPHPGSDAVVPFAEIYKGKKLVSKSRSFLSSFLLYPFLRLVNTQSTSPIFKIRDFLSVLEFVLFSRKIFNTGS